MGRWAAAQRAGGGPQLPNYMLQAVDQSSTVIRVTWAENVTSAMFDFADFTSNPSGQIVDVFTTQSSRVIDLEFASSIAADTTLVYSDPRPGFLTPQTINH